MSVKAKALLTTSFILLIMVAAIYFIARGLLLTRFRQLETETQYGELQNVEKEINKVYFNLSYVASDWSLWDDLDNFLKGKNANFPQINITPGILRRMNVDLVAFADGDGNILYSAVLDPTATQLNPGPEELTPLMKRGGLFWNLQDLKESPNRMIRTRSDSYLISGAAVFPTSGALPSSGTLLFGRRVDAHILTNIQNETNIAVSFFLPEDAPKEFRAIAPEIVSGQSIYLPSTDETMQNGFVVIEGVDGQPAGVLQIVLTRSIFNQGLVALNYLLIGMFAVAVVALAANWLVIQYALLRPMERLARRVQDASDLKSQIRSLDEPESGELNQLSLPIQGALIRAHQVQQESYDRQALVARIFEQAREGFLILEPDTLSILEVNQELLSLLGNPEGTSPIGKPFNEYLLSPLSESGKVAFHSWLENARNGGGGTAEFELSTEQNYRVIEASLYPIEVNAKRYLYALLRDVSERKQLEKSIQERLAETTLLNRVISVSTSNLEPEKVFQTVCAELAIAFGVPQASLAVVEREQKAVRIVAEYISPGRPSILGEVIHSQGSGLADDLLRTRRLYAFDRVEDEPRLALFLSLIVKREVKSILLIPLVIQEEVIGLLILESIVPRQFSQSEVDLAKNIASAASRAYEVAQLYQSLQKELQQRQRTELDLAKRERFLETLVEVQTRMLGGSSWAEVYPGVLKALGEVAQADRVYIFKNHTDIDGGLFANLVAEWVGPDIKPEIDNPALQNVVFTGTLQRLYDSLSVGQPYSSLVSDLPQEERASYQKQEILSFLVLPLTTGGVFSGLIGFDNIHFARVWRPSEVALLMVSAAAISMAYERFDAIDAMRQSEERYRAVVENAHDVIFQMDLSGRFMFLNPSWERLTGISLRESLGLPFWKIAPVGMLQQLQTAYRILRERVTDHYHQMMVFTDNQGETVWLDTYARMITNSEGRGMLIAGTMIDISQFKRIEYQLRRNEESLRALYDITSSQQLTYEQKALDLLMMGSRTFELDSALIGRIDGEDLVVDFSYPEDGLQPGRVIKLSDTYTREILRANEPVGVERVAETDWAGHPAYQINPSESVLGTAVLVNNQIYGILLFTGINPRQHGFTVAEKEFARLMAQWVGAEIERDRYTNQLQQFNEEIALKSSELSEARDQALEASRLKSEFLATMSHEIRTPLNAVIGMTELLLDSPLNNQQDEFVHIIQDSGKSLLVIINDILDFSKIEAGRLSLEMVEFEILPVVEGVVDMFLQASHAKNLSIMSYVSPKIPQKLVGDPARLRQIFVNLVGNAVKFTENGEIVVRVGMVSQDSSTIRLLCKVYDSGIGLSEVARRRLFQPFTQADGSTTRKYGGTGLGLAISKRLVEMMNGEIGVFSEENVGSTFWFTICLEIGSNSKPALADAKLRGLRTIVVDGDATQRRFLVAYLTSWEMIADQARTANEALDMVEKALRAGDPYQLVIWGLDSPGMNWNELRNYFDTHSELAHMRTIFLAALEQRGSLNEFVSPGRSTTLYRPIKQSGLFDGIMDLFIPAEEQFGERRKVRETRLAPIGSNLARFVLLAEDNPANQRLAMAQLERLGFRAELVANGSRAFDAYALHPERYDLILMDCQMPVMDGFEASLKIRELEKRTRRHIPIVAMTANAMQGDREACLAAGMDDYVSKPVTIENLGRALEQLFEPETVVDPQNPDLNPINDYDPLDRSVLQGLRDLQAEGEPDFLTELIDLFLEDSAILIDEMKMGLDQVDMAMVRQGAHTLKGSSGSLGAGRLAKLCVDIEAQSRDGLFDSMKDTFQSLEAEYGIVREYLRRERVSES